VKHFLLMAFLSLSLCAEVFKVYTEQNPPFNYGSPNHIQGSSTLLLKQLFEKNAHQFEGNTISLIPWARGYYDVLHVKNTMLYSMARTPDREALFAWVGPIGKLRIGILAKKSHHVVITSAKSAAQYKIGTILNAAAEQLMLKEGFDIQTFDRFNSLESQLKKLKDNRIDCFASNIDAMDQIIKDMGGDVSEYEVVYLLQESDLYFAFNKETNPQTIATLNETLKTLLK
jgi:polar amino acid transport system substrate-binding protein